jgi:hypothetical protein
MPATRILIAEDEGIIAADIGRRLTRLGYEVVGPADTGEEAVRLAASLRPDLVLMDIRLKGPVDGIEATDRIHRDREVPVVYLTAHADEATLARAKVTEPFGYILKPLQERDLRSVVETALYKHRAERALRDSERRHAAALAGVADGVVGVGPDGRVLLLSPAAERITGWPKAEAAGRPVGEVVHLVDEATRAAADPLAPTPGDPLLLLARGGGEVPVEVSVTRLDGDAGIPDGAVVVVRDVSGPRRAEVERHRLEEHLRQALKMEAVGQLAGGVAHDFNNLLTVIGGYAHLFQSTLAPDHPWAGPAAEMARAADRATDLTRQLLAFSRKTLLQPRPVDLNASIRDAARMLDRLLGGNVQLVVDPAPDLGPVTVDPGQLEQVIVNLALNARDAMPDGGRLTLSTAAVVLGPADLPDAPGPYRRLTVTDTGSGMPPEVLPRIFEPFFTTKEVGKGTGLGLATVYGIVRQSDGHITVRSRVGKGTTFDVYLPPAAAPATTMPTPASSGPVAGAGTVLLAEDDECVRGLTRRILTTAGYTVLETASGQEALDLLARHTDSPVDILVTDMVMPGMGGRELAERVTRDRPGLPILCVSGYTEPAGGVPAGIAFLRKPYSPSDLTRTVRNLIGR